MYRSIVFLLGCAAVSYGLYSPSDDVIDLDASSFNREVVNSDDLWIIEFYAPWCGHCQQLAPEYKKAATALKGIAKVGAVDMDKHQSVGGPYNVRGFPTIKVFGANKNSPSDYNGARSASGLVDAALNGLRQITSARLSGRGGSSGGGSGSRGGSSGGSKPGNQDDVIELTDSNFEKLVYGSDDIWLVEFFAPWCGHCKNLAPQWASAATELKGKVKVAAVDATVNTVVASRFGIRGYPTIKYFPAGAKDQNSAEEYDGGRTSGDIVRWALDKLAENVPPPKVEQITSSKVLEDACAEKQLCIVAFLPHILDCQSKCRNDYISVLSELGAKYKKKMWGWAWSEAGQQSKLEDALGIGGFGYPAMAAVNSRKGKYSPFKGSFGQTGIDEFLKALSFGRGSTVPIGGGKLPEAADIDAWDGKDGELPKEEEIDLSDVKLDDEL
ncbi:DgyrCDS6173 [Dimorphilus gyrociliatus]|uniref:protein disulfide-isomerase n=1 Tax=Dimorphilus gyrociliatus TaxID=2664684 RepID=A0A7I8VPL1_9ANNE|nr:DgyrCDS6173 [Dimorphilus gyrociliatus]